MKQKEFKIVAFSDTHSMHDELQVSQLPPADIFIHAGDFTMDCQVSELCMFQQFISCLPYRHKIVIPGNHDFIFDPDSSKNAYSLDEAQKWRKSLKEKCHFLEFQMIDIDGISILAISKGPEYFDWKFSFAKAQGDPIIEKYKKKVDILVTHWPPYGILDQINKKQKGGSKGLLEFVKAIKPKVHIFGHIHEKRGTWKEFDVEFYNASSTTKDYDFIDEPLEISFIKQQIQKQEAK